MGRRLDSFIIKGKLFMQLFPWPQSREDDFDFTVRLETGEANQVRRQVGDLDGLAHIEDENLSAVSHCGSLKHELRRLWDGHEVTLSIRMSNGQRPASRDLLLKNR